MAGDLQLALLGKLEVRQDGLPVVGLSSAKAQALLCYLAVTGRPHFRTTLAGLLWGDMPETNARANLRRELSALRRTVGDHLIITRQEVAFRDDAPYWLDVEAFQAATDQRTFEGLREAVELYRGDFLEGFHVRDAPAFEDWALVQATRLRELALQSLHTLSVHYAEQGESGLKEGIKYTSRLLALEPSREEAHRGLMLLLAQSGQRGAALAQYEVCRQALAEDLDVEPGPETRELYQRIRAGDVGRRAAPVPRSSVAKILPSARLENLSGATRTEPAVDLPHNLPPQPTPFIGREEELDDLDDLIADPDVRLITIVGPGGMGKTRLALSAAERLLSQRKPTFPHGVFFVPLAGLSSAVHMVPTLAEALGFQFQEGGGRTPRRQIVDYLREKRMLLVIDNIEHLLAPASFSQTAGGSEGSGEQLLIDILRAARDVKLVVTSRGRLNLRQEQVFPLHGLPFPKQGAPVADAKRFAALKLFAQAARRVRPDFQLTADDLPHLTHVINLVGGMPLGIELAASWVDMLSLVDIAAEIQGGLGILATEWRDVPERHRSMRAVFDTSWRHLGAEAQRVFRQLSVFCGGFTREAAREVTGASLRVLTHLANRTVLYFDTAGGRYQIHELLRQYGAEKLAANPEVEAAARDRHSAYYCAWLRQHESDLKGPRHFAAEAEIETEIENVRVAWRRAAERGEAAQLDKALEALCVFCREKYSREDGATACQLAAGALRQTASPEAQRTLAKALAWQPEFSFPFGPSDAATVDALLPEINAILNNPLLADQDTRSVRAFLLYQQGISATFRGAYRDALAPFAKSVALYRELGDRYWLAWALNSGGWASRRCGEYEQARPMTEESLALAQKLDHRLTGRALRHLSILDKIAGDLDAATRRLEQAIAIGEEKRYRVGVAKALRSRGELAELQGRFDEAGEFQQRSIALCREIGLPYFLALALEALGRAHAWRGQLDQAHVRLAESRTLFRELELSQNEARVITRQAIVDLWAGAYRSARERAEAARSMTREADARAMVVDAEGLIGGVLGVLGWLALVAGRYEEAWDLCSESVAASPGAGLPYLELEEWSRVGRGLAAMGLGNRVDAQRCIVKAFEGALAKRTFPALLYLMPTAPAWLAGAAAGDLKARAVELYALANSHPFVANSPLFEDIAGRQLKAATAGLPPEVVTEAQERGRALDWWETAGELLDELNA